VNTAFSDGKGDLGFLPSEHQGIIEDTFKTMCQLHDLGRDHIWGYYVRNLARPLWLSKEGNQVDVIVGNPPWLAYSFCEQVGSKRHKASIMSRLLLWEKPG
jgi:hypothetical protein